VETFSGDGRDGLAGFKIRWPLMTSPLTNFKFKTGPDINSLHSISKHASAPDDARYPADTNGKIKRLRNDSLIRLPEFDHGRLATV
jgi:hypothetical protein